MTAKTVSIAADHRGFYLKSLYVTHLKNKGYQVIDLGTHDDKSCDASDFAQALAIDLRDHKNHKGILICGSGQAMAMTANRYQHIRAALCFDTTMTRFAREHNDANVLVIGSSIIGEAVAMDCLDVFLDTDFLGGRFLTRRDKLTALGGL